MIIPIPVLGSQAFSNVVLGGGADNLGDHTATQDLNMTTNDIFFGNSTNGTSIGPFLENFDDFAINSRESFFIGDNLPAITNWFSNQTVAGGNNLLSEKLTQSIDSINETTNYYRERVRIGDATNSTEDGHLEVSIMKDGILTEFIEVDPDLNNEIRFKTFDFSLTGTGQIKNLLNGTIAQDAVTLSQLQEVNNTAGADNLGNHTATEALNMTTNNIFFGNNINNSTLSVRPGNNNDMWFETQNLWITDKNAAGALQFYSNQTTPTGNNLINNIGVYTTNELTAGFEQYTRDRVRIGDPTNGTEDAHIEKSIMKAGVLTEYIEIDPDQNNEIRFKTFDLSLTGSGQVKFIVNASDAQDAVTLSQLQKVNNTIVPGGADNLGDHIATQDLVMGLNNITFNGQSTIGPYPSAINNLLFNSTAFNFHDKGAINFDLISNRSSPAGNNVVTIIKHISTDSAGDSEIYYQDRIRIGDPTNQTEDGHLERSIMIDGVLTEFMEIDPDNNRRLTFKNFNLSLQSVNQIQFIANGTAPQDAVTKSQLDDVVLSGGADNLGDHTATENLNMTNKNITNTNTIEFESGIKMWGHSDAVINMQTQTANDFTFLRLLPNGTSGIGSGIQLYNTDHEADDVNFDRLNLQIASNALISTVEGGTGVARDIVLLPNNTIAVRFSATNQSSMFSGTVDMGLNNITFMANGTASQDAITLSQLQKVNNTITGGGDDLGDHIMDQDLQTNNFDIDFNAGQLIDGESNHIDIQVATGQGVEIEVNSIPEWHFNADRLNATNNQIVNLANATLSQDAVALSQLQKVNNTITDHPVYENNTASNLNLGAGLFAQKVLDDLEFKSLANGTGISISNNATNVIISTDFLANSITCGGNDKISAFNNITGLYICTTDLTVTASNLNEGAGLFAQKTLNDLEFKSLANGTGISISNNATNVIISTNFTANTITCSGNDKISSYNNITGVYTCSTDQAGGANVKSGDGGTISLGGTDSVTFGTAFVGTPQVIVQFTGNVNHYSGEKGTGLSVYSITTDGFTVRYDGSSAPIDPASWSWIATDAGDP